MSENAGFAYILGLIICSFALGINFSAFVGWVSFGSGLMMLGALIGMLGYLDGGKKDG